MNNNTKRDEALALARKRASLILAVRGGKLSVGDASRELGVSRKTYYEWESKALDAMAASLENGAAGRPAAQSDPQVEALRHRVKELEDELALAGETLHVRRILDSFHEVQDKKKYSRKKKGSKR